MWPLGEGGGGGGGRTRRVDKAVSIHTHISCLQQAVVQRTTLDLGEGENGAEGRCVHS